MYTYTHVYVYINTYSCIICIHIHIRTHMYIYIWHTWKIGDRHRCNACRPIPHSKPLAPAKNIYTINIHMWENMHIFPHSIPLAPVYAQRKGIHIMNICIQIHVWYPYVCVWYTCVCLPHTTQYLSHLQRKTMHIINICIQMHLNIYIYEYIYVRT